MIKASELITILQEHIKNEGDSDVFKYCSNVEDVTELTDEDLSIYTFKGVGVKVFLIGKI